MALCGATATQAAESPIPSPPEAPPWIEPIPLTAQLQVSAHLCDGKDEPDEPANRPGFKPQWRDDGRLRLSGTVLHNGSERLDSSDVAAWRVGDRLVVAYQLRVAGAFPEAPMMACLGHTHVEITFPALSPRPKDISVYASRLEYAAPVRVELAPD